MNLRAHLVRLSAVIFTAVFLLQIDPCSAESDVLTQYTVRVWQPDEGLPHNTVEAIAQTRDGYLWVGTYRGLARFDGARFALFDPESVPELKCLSINALCESRDGTLWIGSINGKLLQCKEGVVRDCGKEAGVAGARPNGVLAIYQSKDGVVWLGRQKGLIRFQDGAFIPFDESSLLSKAAARSICEDADGGLWFSCGEELIGLRDGNVTCLHYTNELQGIARSVCRDCSGGLWVGMSTGLARMEGGKIARFSNKDGLSGNPINAVYEDRGGNLWVGASDGLSRRAGGKFISERNSEGDPYDSIYTFFEDREGDLWVGAKDGLYRMTQRSFYSYTTRHGLKQNNIMSVCGDSAGGLWVGTWGGGVNKLDPYGEVTSYSMAGLGGQSGKLILALCAAQDGSLWIGADYDGGLFHLQNGSLARYYAGQGLDDPAVRVICEDRRRNLWVGTSGALYRLQDNLWTRFSVSQGLAGNTVRAILEDHEGAIWIGTTDGLSRFTDGRFLNFTVKDGLSHNTVVSLYEDRDKVLWIGTGGGGLNRLRLSPRPCFASYTTRQGLFSNDVFEILEDDQGYLWMSSLTGVFRVSKKELDDLDRGAATVLHCVSFGKADGMASAQCNGVAKPAGWKGADGRLWFPTIKGLATVDPRVKSNELAPPMAIEQILADGKNVLPEYGRSIDRKNEVIVSPGHGELEFHYTALSFRAPEKNRFKFRLEGVDSSWVEAGTRRVAYYNNLSPGQYRFQVAASNNDGVWNEHDVSLTVVLLPHFWQTWWFMGLMVFAGICSASGAARYITWKRVRRQIDRLERRHAVEQERTRIAQDMHDEMGARLTEIRILSNLTINGKSQPSVVEAHNQRISQAASELIDNLRSIVWAVNPRNDSLEKLADYVCEFAQSFLKTSAIRCRLDCPASLPSIMLSSEIRHNTFLAVKEALNNVAKHAKASEVHIALSVNDATLALSISDNGKGFQPGKASARGNGLQNMERRMERINGDFHLLTEGGKGTTIRFSIPIKHAAAN